MKQWTGTEIGFLKRSYSSAERAFIQEQLPLRSWRAINEMAHRLGLRRLRNWEKIASEHRPIFILPSNVPIPVRRPWT